MINILFLFSLIIFSFASELQIVAQNDDFQKAPEFQAIMTKLSSYGEFSAKITEEQVVVNPANHGLSKGQQMVEEAKARNRAILAEKNKEGHSKPVFSGVDQWREEVKKTQDGWKKEILQQRKTWQREQKIFLGHLREYKENTFNLPIKGEKITEKKMTVDTLPRFFIVNSAFKVPIRNQQDRPTCSAFAGIRALEVILAQNKMEHDLSEQYLYWASKPNCQTSPCSEKGSWIPLGLKHSQIQAEVDIPLENTCSYGPEKVEGNETQLPLSSSCKQGKIKVLTFEEVRTISDMVEKLKTHTPVIMAAKLSENFYINEGLVSLAEVQNNTGKLDAHAQGHAMLAIGIIELPIKLKPSEGNFCIVVANSWSEGWGAGGYSCLTENWLIKFRQPAPFYAITKISIK